MQNSGNKHQRKRPPYGVGRFDDIHRKGFYYVDKTPFIPKIENAGKYLFFMRPRSFGKSFLLSTLYYYYNVSYAEVFEKQFADT